jgi:peptidyl-dipeptidase Dcp
MKKILILGGLLAMIACTQTARNNPLLEKWDTPYGVPPFDKIETADYLPAIDSGIAQQRAEIKAIKENKEAPTFENTIAALDRSGEILSRVDGVLFNVAETDADDALNAVVDSALAKLTELDNEISSDKDLFARVKAVYEADQSGLTREQQMLLKQTYEGFVRSGIDLPDSAQAELKEINLKLSAMQQKFGNNLLAENNAFKEKFGIPISSYVTAMTNTADRQRRHDMFVAYSTRGANGGANDTRQLCIDILKLRARMAQILGYSNFAEYALADKMAGKPETVDAFLKQVMDASMHKAKEEVYDMQAVMDRDIKAGLLPEGSKIEPWDWYYYAEKVRLEKYALDESQTKPYFELDSVRNGIFAAAHRIYGINVTPAEGLPVYNPEVKTFKVTDTDGSLLGIFYCDYLPRSTKRGGAWMNNIREQYVDENGNDVRPIIVNVGNMTPPTDSTPSLLTIDEVQTVFHEFGHALHGLLTKCHYAGVSGTNVKRDFVETFSQFNEHWAFQKEILADYAYNYKTGETIPDSLVAKINKSLKFNQGFMEGELAAASILDMRWHELPYEAIKDIDTSYINTFEAQVCKDMGLIKEIIPRYRTTYYNHIFNSGYAANYYSYVWTDVLANDAFSEFEKNGIYDKATAKKFRETFLEKGGSEEPMTLYLQFRGAMPDASALIHAKGLDE